MRIRAARRDDYGAVTRLLEELGRPTAAGEAEADCRAIWDDQVVDPDSHHLVAEGDSGVVAFCSLHFRMRLNRPTPEAWIPDLVVADSARRAGIGLALLEEVQRRARDRGCHAIALECGYNRAEAHHLYRTFRMRDQGKFFRKELTGPAHP
jgi:GNAT superfamily N-acetyltransferase